MDCIVFILLDCLAIVAIKRPSWLHVHITFDSPGHSHDPHYPASYHQQNDTDGQTSGLRTWNRYVDTFPWIRYSSEISILLSIRIGIRIAWLLSAFLLIRGNRSLQSGHFVPWQFMTGQDLSHPRHHDGCHRYLHGKCLHVMLTSFLIKFVKHLKN